jgi:hypothetical protein
LLLADPFAGTGFFLSTVEDDGNSLPPVASAIVPYKEHSVMTVCFGRLRLRITERVILALIGSAQLTLAADLARGFM